MRPAERFESVRDVKSDNDANVGKVLRSIRHLCLLWRSPNKSVEGEDGGVGLLLRPSKYELGHCWHELGHWW